MTKVRNWPPVEAILHGELRPLESLSPGGRTAAAIRLGFKMRTWKPAPPLPSATFDLDSSRVVLDPNGLPRCGIEELRDAPERQVGRICQSARIGTGGVTYSGGTGNAGAAFSFKARMVVFNGRSQGRPSILGRLLASQGLRRRLDDNVVVFRLVRREGAFDTSLVADFPILRLGHNAVSALDLSLERRFHAHGEARSLVTATCGGGSSASQLPYARITRLLQDGSEMSGALEGQCRARGRSSR
jgi:hypothetical protein